MNEVKLSEKYIVQIDCAPGSIRPNDIIGQVLRFIPDLTEKDFIVTARFMGEWTFSLKLEKESTYEKHKNTIGDKLTELYRLGALRYATW